MLNTRNGNPTLIKLIRAEIEKQGPISFAWFMHQALYYPEHGYYSSGRCAIGRKGDYFTNVSVGPLFGQLLGAQLAEIWERLGKIDNFMIVEQGAHDGQFARDVLQSVQKRAPEFFEALRYRIVEPFPVLQERQAQTLEPFRDRIEWCDSLQPFVGVHFSNELLDAMPVRMISGGVEKLVDLEGDEFVLVERPLRQGAAASSGTVVLAEAARLRRDEGSFNQAALDWIDDVAANLQRGYVITIDYGRSDAEFQGAVQVRARHRNLDSPFEQIGHADITMQVDWPSIAERAQANGLLVAGFTDQHHFLTGIISELGRLGSPEATAADWGQSPLPDSPRAKRELQTLLHPEMLGRAFQVLAVSKNVAEPAAGGQFLQPKRHRHDKASDRRSWVTQPIQEIGYPSSAKRVDSAASKLAGFKFAREPRSALGGR
ncbi:MAG TPA: SAM-dependent methyltransferase [Candidatus Udaeobacter sp.]|nr:SAM-dependent methyltransferase [Candidatus Udaeobacter sp.]